MTDTNALVYWAGGKSRRLGKRAVAAFERADAGRATIYVPAIVSLEIWLLALKGTVKLELGLRQWWRSVVNAHWVMVENSHDDVLDAFDLRWAHQDFFDRLIVQSALRLGVPLITSDVAITEWGGVEVVW
jgi:PIN domain nuclease of toxin-antitoxin system